MNQSQSQEVDMESQGNIDEEAYLIRKEYRNIREELAENRLNYIDPNSNALEMCLENVNEIFKNVKKPREGVSDHDVLLELAVLGKERIRNVHCVFRSFNNNEYMEKLKSYMGKMDKNKFMNGTTIKTNESDEENDKDSDESDDEISKSRINKTTQKKKLRSRTSEAVATNKQYVLTKTIITEFGKKVMNYFRIPPRPTFLIGSLDKEIPVVERKARQRKVEKNVEQLKTKIKEIDANSNENESSSTVTEIERIYKILKKSYLKHDQAPICLYEFIIDPNSFSRSIENMFYVSFLVKDGLAKIFLDNDELPVIVPVIENEPSQFGVVDNSIKNKNTANKQSMINFSKIEWKQIIEVFKIKEAFIPPR